MLLWMWTDCFKIIQSLISLQMKISTSIFIWLDQIFKQFLMVHSGSHSNDLIVDKIFLEQFIQLLFMLILGECINFSSLNALQILFDYIFPPHTRVGTKVSCHCCCYFRVIIVSQSRINAIISFNSFSAKHLYPIRNEGFKDFYRIHTLCTTRLYIFSHTRLCRSHTNFELQISAS